MEYWWAFMLLGAMWGVVVGFYVHGLIVKANEQHENIGEDKAICK